MPHSGGAIYNILGHFHLQLRRQLDHFDVLPW